MAANNEEWNNVVINPDGGHDFKLIMTFRNFLNYVCSEDEYVETPKFECSRHCGETFVLRLYPHEECDNEIYVYLQIVDLPDELECDSAIVNFSLIGQDGKVLINRYVESTAEHLLKPKRCGPSYLIKRKDVKDNKDIYLPMGHLTLLCTGTVFHTQPTITMDTVLGPATVIDSNELSSSTILKKLLQDGLHSDVVLKTGATEFQCHKSVLAASCSYFNSMFEHEMKENVDNVVDLSKELDGVGLKCMLDYLYTGKMESVGLNQASYQNLYRTADMYDIEGLRRHCEDALVKLTDSKNATELFIFANTQGAKKLKRVAAVVFVKSSE